VKAEMIITNAKVLTMDEERPRAEAVALAGGRILAVGSREEVEALAGREPASSMPGGGRCCRGSSKAICIWCWAATSCRSCNWAGVAGFEELARAFRAYAAKNPDLPLLMAQGAVMKSLTIRSRGRPGPDPRRPPHRDDVARPPHGLGQHGGAGGGGHPGRGADAPGHVVVMAADGTATGELLEFEAFSPVLALTGDLHLQLGIATGGEPEPWPDAGQRAKDKEKVAAGLAHCAARDHHPW
jgi:hypothetical protein